MIHAIAGRCSRAMTARLSTLTLTLLVSSAPALAATINVVAADVPGDGLCSLPEAVAALNDNANCEGVMAGVSAGDTLLLDEGASYLLLNQLVLQKPVTITSVNGRAVIDGGGAVPLIRIEASAAGTVVSNLRLTGGHAGHSEVVQTLGGGLQVNGSVRIDNVIMDNNKADRGGAIHVFAQANVGDVVVTVINSHIKNNHAFVAGGGIEAGATLVVEATTVSGNTADGQTGGIYNTGLLHLRRSTISGNALTTGGAPGAGINNRGSILVEQSTIAFNTPDGFRSDHEGSDVVEFTSSLVANNGDMDCSSSRNFASQGHNLVQNAGDCASFFDETTDILGQDPRLQPLAATGSGLPVHLLDPDGAAFGAGDDVGIEGVVVQFDQRGNRRRVGEPEIGAVEMQCIEIATFSCSAGLGLCKRSGVWNCDANEAAACNAEPGTPEAEQCDDLDHDCDGVVRNGNPGGDLTCTTPLPGACRDGVTLCTEGGVVCVALQTPSAELCNGTDDDCNGAIDEGVDILCGTSCDFDVDCGGEVGLVCEGGVCTAGCRSSADCGVGQSCDPTGPGTCIASGEGEGEGEGGGEIGLPGTPGDPGDALPEKLKPFRFVSCASGDTGAEVLGLFAVALLWRPRSRRRRPNMAALVVMLTWATTATAQAPTAAPTTAPSIATHRAMRTLSMDLEHRNLSAEQAQLITGMVAVELSTYDALDVVAGADIRRAMALEGDKQSMGCSADASCLAEIADAMDAELVVFGEIGVLDGVTIINLNLYDPRAVQSVGRATVRSRGPEDLDAELRRGIRQLLEKTLVARGHALSSSMATSASLLPVAVAASGGVVAAVGAVLVYIGLGTAREYQRLSDAYDAADSIQDKRDLQEKAEAAQSSYDNDGGRIVVYGGGAMVVVGLAVGIGGTVWALQGE